MSMIDDKFLELLQQLKPFSSIETEFGRFLCRLSRLPASATSDVPAPDAAAPAAPPPAAEDSAASPDAALWRFLAFLLLRYVQDGHSCVDIVHWQQALLAQLNELEAEADQELKDETLAAFSSALSALSPTKLHDTIRDLASRQPLLLGHEAGQGTPLILHEDKMAGLTRIYLNKYRQYELDVAAWIKRALAVPADQKLPLPEIRQIFHYFRNSTEDPDHQQLAVQKAVARRFAIITGGPGTGKTTVLSAILALICQQLPHWRIALAAPTGKAKARMQEAIAEGVQELSDAISEQIKEKLLGLEASTLHSLLGLSPDRAMPYHHAENPLQLDLVVIDEASMVSLPDMAQLMRALRPEARLLLLGDKDQLSSVETGSVLADLCRSKPLQDSIATLHKNYRAKDNSALIHCAQRVVNASEADAEAAALADDIYAMRADPAQPDAEFKADSLPAVEALSAALRQKFEQWGLLAWKKAKSVEECFAFADSFKILASNREGPFGVVNLNKLIGEVLGIALGADRTPIMILRNDKLSGLHNGDIGIIWKNQAYFPSSELEEQNEPDEPGSKSSAKDSGKKYRVFALAGLPRYEHVYAMTIHKSQGSGYEKVLMVLPEKVNPVLTRELLYTGITRTKLKFQLWAPKEVLQSALQKPTQRISGLTQLLDASDA
jgi:exodeoxyribonuclease V alpha subunit